MGKSRSMEVIEGMVQETVTSQEYGQQMLEQQGLDPGRLTDLAPMDDGFPPNGPTGIVVTPFMKSLDVSWDQPPVEDAVKAAQVEVTPAAGTPTVYTVEPPSGKMLSDLPYVQHTIRVKFVDLWNRESDWSEPFTGTPSETADYKIDLAKAQQTGRLQGMIPALNTQALSGDPTDMVKQVALAQGDSGNMLPLKFVDFDVWDNNQEWPPNDSDVNDTPYFINYSTTKPTNQTIVKMRNGGKWLWMRRDNATDNWFYPFAGWRQYGMFTGEYYILSCYVDGSAGTRVRLNVRVAADEAGANAIEYMNSDVITLDNTSGGKRVFVRFLLPNTHPYMEWYLSLVDNNTEAYVSKFQLERSGTKLEPSPWSPGILSTGVFSARAIGAIDVNAANAIFKNAVIDSAAIKELTADKIVGGSISTTTISIASELTMATGGVITAGATKIDSGGLTIATQPNYDTTAMASNAKITGANDQTAIAFFSDTGNAWNGVVARADGTTASGNNGIIALHATRDGTLGSLAGGATTSGALEVKAVTSGVGHVNLYWDTYVKRNLIVTGSISMGSVSLPANSVGASQIVDGSVGAAEIADGSVGAAELGTNSVGTDEIATGAVGSDEIANGAIGDTEMAAGMYGGAWANQRFRAIGATTYYGTGDNTAATRYHWHAYWDYASDGGDYHRTNTMSYP